MLIFLVIVLLGLVFIPASPPTKEIIAIVAIVVAAILLFTGYGDYQFHSHLFNRP